MEKLPEKMDPEDKAKLIAALRSGDYKQGQSGWLCEVILTENGYDYEYSWLGVAADVLVDFEWVLSANRRFYLIDGYAIVLPPELLPELTTHHFHVKRSFKRIADWIEINL